MMTRNLIEVDTLLTLIILVCRSKLPLPSFLFFPFPRRIHRSIDSTQSGWSICAVIQDRSSQDIRSSAFDLTPFLYQSSRLVISSDTTCSLMTFMSVLPFDHTNVGGGRGPIHHSMSLGRLLLVRLQQGDTGPELTISSRGWSCGISSIDVTTGR